MNRLTTWLVLAFVFLAAHPCFPWYGKCVGISDGDTIRVMHLGKTEKIRLFGID
jgi:endonuclease YncB( thermonuclease family)